MLNDIQIETFKSAMNVIDNKPREYCMVRIDTSSMSDENKLAILQLAANITYLNN